MNGKLINAFRIIFIIISRTTTVLLFGPAILVLISKFPSISTKNLFYGVVALIPVISWIYQSTGLKNKTDKTKLWYYIIMSLVDLAVIVTLVTLQIIALSKISGPIF